VSGQSSNRELLFILLFTIASYVTTFAECHVLGCRINLQDSCLHDPDPIYLFFIEKNTCGTGLHIQGCRNSCQWERLLSYKHMYAYVFVIK